MANAAIAACVPMHCWQFAVELFQQLQRGWVSQVQLDKFLFFRVARQDIPHQNERIQYQTKVLEGSEKSGERDCLDLFW